MPEVINGDGSLHQQFIDFEQQNPKVMEALKLFGMTMTQYRGAMNAMNPVQFVQGSNTIRINEPRKVDEEQ